MAHFFDQYERDDERANAPDQNSPVEENLDMEAASARFDMSGATDEQENDRGEDGQQGQTERPRARRTSTRKTTSKRNPASGSSTHAIIQLSERAARRDQHGEQAGEPDSGVGRVSVLEELDALRAQGFTADEAVKLIDVSDRVAHGSEARESESTLRRLRFTRWLIEHGILDEFTA